MPGGTAKLGPLATTYLCTRVKGLLDKLMIHLGLGPSIEEPWGLLALVLCGVGNYCLPWGSTICLGSSISPLPTSLHIC